MKNKSKISLLILVIFAVTAFSCNSSDTKSKSEIKKTEDGNFNPYFPLKENHKWVYINEAPRDETITFTIEAKDSKKVDSGIQFKVSSFPYLTQDNAERTLTVRSNGEIEIGNYMGTSGVIITSPGNFKTGNKWSFGLFNATVISEKETAVTEDGTYNDCVYIMMTDGFTFSYEMWFKKDVGIVKWGANRTNPPQLKPLYYVMKDHKLN
ncbi:MAG TPA: hypothetical protein VG961_08975 [Ignavibacteria bacterium]|nr:hypothetical protein [Ignavibacteria bacterium]